VDNKPATKRHALAEEKLDEMENRLEHTREITETPCTTKQLS
jgi:hypothetical protein